MALKNPYDDEKDTAIYRVSPASCWAAIVLFLLVCTIPPLARNVTGGFDAFTALFKKPADVTLPVHLRQAEKKIEDAPFTKPPRHVLQSLATSLLHEGNSKTIIGKDGWLFLRPGVEALTGTGPLQAPPIGPASDPALKKAHGPTSVVERFAADLKERGIRLLLVPVPIKPTIYPENLGNLEAPLTHPDAPAFYELLKASGIEVLNLSPDFVAAKKDRQVYLKQDTHWTPETMQAAARSVAGRLSEFEGTSEFEVTSEQRSHIGDLVEKLEIEESFNPETATLQVVSGETRSRRSPIVLLGDSFVNIFSDPTIGFGNGSEEPINAGFAEHLALALKTSIDVIAKNGDASTGVRKDFAKRPDNQVRDKKAVVWLIAERDLFYPPKLAAENNVTWENVTWNTKSKPYLGEESPDALVIEATLKRAAKYADPSQVNYPSSTYETEWETAEGETYRIKLWAFQESKIVPSGQLEVGKTYKLKLVPEEMATDARSAQSIALDDLYYGDTYFGELAGE